MTSNASFAATLRAAEAVISQHAKTRQAPLVVWQGLAETVEAFDARAAAIRERLPDNLALLAVCLPHPGLLPGVRLVELAPKMFELLHPSVPSRYRVASGGRGSAKSYSFAVALVLRALSKPMRVLCCREIQKSIRESVHKLLVDRIDGMSLSPWFEVREYSITAANGSEFLFDGLLANASKLKSLEGIDLCYVEEAETVSDRSLEILVPTIRAPNSEIWLSLNPDKPDDPSYERFVTAPPPNCRHVHVTYADNPWWPPELEAERQYLQGVDEDAYRHVWLGECRVASDAQVFKGKYTVEAFEPVRRPANGIIPAGAPKPWDGPYFGADWGFSQDPTTLIKAWISDRTLYIEHEAYGLGVDIDRTPALFDSVPGARDYTIRADNARPETINYLQRHGYRRIVAVNKWPDSVVDGIAHLRSYERIVIHPRCTHVIDEFRQYSYKVDRLTGDVMPDLVDKHNHCVDALRYALTPAIRRRNAVTYQPLRI